MHRRFTSGLSTRVRALIAALVVMGLLPAAVVTVPATAAAASTSTSSTSSGTTNPRPPTPTTTELTAGRSAYSSTYVLPGGKRKTVLSSVPVNYKSASGAWGTIDNSLVASASGGWHDAANSVHVSLPSSLSSPVTVSSGSSSIGFTLQGASGAGSASGSVATYSSVLPATSASYQVTGSGVKEDLTLGSASAPSTFTWSLSLSSGMTASVAGNGGLSLSSAGTVVASIAPPTVTDASGATGTASWSLSGTTLTLSADSSWLSAPARAFPVVVDPSVTYLGPTQGCTLKAANPTNTYCDTSDLGVGASSGSAQRAVLDYPGFTDGTLPVDAVISEADLGLPVASLTGSVTVNAYGLSRSFNSDVTWDSYNGISNWTTPGGDDNTTPTSSATAPSAGTPSP